MFGVLLKKQLHEVFRSWFYDPKTNKVKSKSSTVTTILFFVLVTVGLLGGSFTAMAVPICEGLHAVGMEWLYFTLLGTISVIIGLFGSVFNTFSGLYLAKDNDLLLSMPIPVGTVIASRIFNVYLMGTLYSSLAFVPAIIVYQVLCGFSLPILAGNVFMLLEISVLVLVLSCLLGFAVARVSLKVKNKSFVTVLASLAFIGTYYFCYFKAQTAIRNLVANAVAYGTKIRDAAYILYVWGQNSIGHAGEIALCMVVCMALLGITWLILSKTFLKIATTSQNAGSSRAKARTEKVKPLRQALLFKEMKRFSSSANYMLNCGFGILLLPAMGIGALVKGGELAKNLSEAGELFVAAIPVGVVGIACLLSSMNDMAAPSVSLEGKSLWLVQSLPVDTAEVIYAKVKLQLFFTAIPMAFFCICVAVAIPMSIAEKILCLGSCMLYTVLSALFSMLIGLKMPIFNWSNEIVPIKQSGAVAIALFSGWGYAAVLIGGYVGLCMWQGAVSAALYLGAFLLGTVVLCGVLIRWLRTKGAEILKSL